MPPKKPTATGGASRGGGKAPAKAAVPRVGAPASRKPVGGPKPSAAGKVPTPNKKGTLGNKNKQEPSSKKVEKKWTAEDEAARKIQTAARGYLARKHLCKLRKDKEDYEKLMEELERQAFVQLVKMQQYEIEMERKKDEEERRRRREDMKRRKRMLEASFDGNNDIIESIMKELTDCDDEEGIDHDGLGEIIRKRHLLDMIDCEDPNGNTPLSEAASGGNVWTIRLLIEKGAIPNTRGHFNRTPIYRAAFAGHLEAVQELLGCGADPRIYADDGQTPEQVASTDDVKEFLHEWDIERTELLLEKLLEEKELRAEEDRERREFEVQQLEEQVRKAACEYKVTQTKLVRASDELNRLIEEYDMAVASGFQNQELLLKAIHDAELTLETAKIDSTKAREHLDIVRMQCRDSGADDDSLLPGIKIHIKELDDVLLRDVGNKIEESGKWPLVIDPSQQAATFLRYRDTNYINAQSSRTMDKDRIRMSIIGALRYGKPLVVDMLSAEQFDQVCIRFDEIQDGLMKSILDKSIMNSEKFEKLLREDDGEEYARKKFNNMRVRNFKFFLLTQAVVPTEDILNKTYVIKVKIN